MADLVPLLFDVLLPLALCFYIVRTWVRWFRTEPRLVGPKGKSRISVFGFATSNISLSIIVATMIHGLVGSRSLPEGPMDAVILATSLLALVAALIGTGPLGFPTAVCSVFCLVMIAISALAR